MRGAPPSQQVAHPRRKRRRRVLALTLLAGVVVWLTAAFVMPALEGEPEPKSGAVTLAATGDAVDEVDSGASDHLEVSNAADVGDQDAGGTTTAPPLAPLPTCEYGSEAAPLAGLDQWPYTLLDTTYHLPAEYAPTDLVSLPAVLADVAPGAYLAAEGHQLRAAAADALAALFAAAEAAGVQLAVQSAYRSYAYQASTFEYWVQQDGREAALRTSARAGHSEHQLGTAVDLRSRQGPAAWDLADWAATPEGAWVAANAHRFGFVMSYPRGEEARSCYAYEPWHYRYVGADMAAEIHATGEPPRVVLWQHVQMHQAAGTAAEETP